MGARLQFGILGSLEVRSDGALVRISGRRQRALLALPLCHPNAVAADAGWARIDRELTDLAIWVPTVTPNETDIVSRRVTNYQYNPVWGALLDQFRVQ